MNGFVPRVEPRTRPVSMQPVAPWSSDGRIAPPDAVGKEKEADGSNKDQSEDEAQDTNRRGRGGSAGR